MKAKEIDSLNPVLEMSKKSQKDLKHKVEAAKDYLFAMDIER